MTRLRAVGAAGVLVLLAVGVIAAGDSRAWSGGDAGGRAATAVAMQARGDWTPSVGYWAQRWDPDGRYHPLVNTERRGEHWVQATSVPFAIASRPLLRWFGFPGLLLLPVAGMVLAAAAAAALARWAGPGSGWPAFWAVGVLTPALFYAGDAWEHAPALGLALGALALAVVGKRWPTAVGAGLGAGLAVVLRAEMAIYAVAAGVAALAVADQRRRWVADWRRGALIVVAAAVPVAINAAVERCLLASTLRTQRAAALVEGAGTSRGSRLSDAALTSVGVVAESSSAGFAVGALVSAALVALGWWAVWGRPGWSALVAGVIALGLALGAAVRLTDGLGFVPGWLPAAPIAGAGLAALLRPRREPQLADERRRFLAAAALLGLPGVWATSHVGLLEAQWGGRYVLLTGALLTIVGVVMLSVPGARRAAAGLVAVAVLVSGLGLAWRIDRTHEIADVASWLVSQTPDDGVVVSRWPELGREAGAWYGERRWLTAEGPADTAGALDVAGQAGAGHVVLVVPDGVATGPTPGWSVAGRRTHQVFGTTVAALRMERTA